ncbi:hypothetical protein LINPERPRIM_LOCUS23076 [Linum perenne]
MVSPSSDFSSRHGRILVERDGRSHFIFMDEDQMRWFLDVLVVAAKARWKLSAVCVRRSARRSVTIGAFWKNGVRFLCVRERCRDGKVFFVNIPMDIDSVGWRQLSEAVSGCIRKVWGGRYGVTWRSGWCGDKRVICSGAGGLTVGEGRRLQGGAGGWEGGGGSGGRGCK